VMSGITAYVVTKGEYSDYRIKRVFLSKPDAERYLAVETENGAKYDYWVMEEFDITDLEEPTILYKTTCHITSGESAKIWSSREVIWGPLPKDLKLGLGPLHAVGEYVWERGPQRYPNRIHFDVTELDEKRATKIATDMAIQVGLEFDATWQRLVKERDG